MSYYGFQQPGYGGMPPPMIPPQGQMYQQGPTYPQGGYGNPYQGGLGGMAPNLNCMYCRGSGYRMSRKGKTKKCKCIKQQEKMMGKYYGYSSSDSD